MNRLIFAAALVAVAYIGAYSAAALDQELIEPPEAICDTDTDCMRFCPEGTWDLPPDHPDYCDGGPQ
jgi:hypothetical protein